MPPEYIMEGILSTKYDVYSFGVILLEAINGMCGVEAVRRQASVEWVSNRRHRYTRTSICFCFCNFIKSKWITRVAILQLITSLVIIVSESNR